MRLILLLCCGLLMFFVSGACKKQTAVTGITGEQTAESGLQQKSGKIHKPDMVNCNGFAAADAATILGLPPAKMTAGFRELHADNWNCLFESGDIGKTLSFNVSVAKSIEDASREMAQYRSRLEAMAGVSPFKESLPKGAYSYIGGLGDEAVWTEINASLTVRTGNVRIQIMMPKDRPVQMKVAEKFLSTLK